MQILLTIVFLTGNVVSANIPGRLTWETDYLQARSRAIEDDKPLAVFLARGQNNWKMVARDGVDQKVAQLLGDRYVCIFIDVDDAKGKKLASTFQVAAKGLVISDRSGNSQQFHHSGEMSSADLLKALERYSDRNRPFNETESIAQLTPPAPQTFPQYQSVPQYQYAPPQYQYAPAIRLSGG